MKKTLSCERPLSGDADVAWQWLARLDGVEPAVEAMLESASDVAMQNLDARSHDAA